MNRREQRVEQMRKWLHEVGEAQGMIASVMRKNGVVTVAQLAEKHPKQFNSLFEAVATMEEEMPEPKFPWPTT